MIQIMRWSGYRWMPVRFLYRQEDVSDSFYIVIQVGQICLFEIKLTCSRVACGPLGRKPPEALRFSALNLFRLLRRLEIGINSGEHGQGESVGELESITGATRPSTVHAIRDSELARMPMTLFQRNRGSKIQRLPGI